MWSYQIGNKERASTILIAQLWKPVTNVDCFDLEADQWYLQPKPDHHPHHRHYEGNSPPNIAKANRHSKGWHEKVDRVCPFFSDKKVK